MRYFLIMLFSVSLISCSQQNEIIKVELARSGAWQNGASALSIDSSLNSNYLIDTLNNGKIVHTYYTGKVTSEFWNSLVSKLEKIKYREIDSTENMSGADVSYFELLVESKKGRKRIIRMQSFNPTDSLGNLLYWLNESYKHPNLKKTKEPVKFQTTYQSNGFAVDQEKYIKAQF